MSWMDSKRAIDLFGSDIPRHSDGTPKVTVEFARRVLKIVDAGLVNGVGEPAPGQMCVEAAVAYASGEEHGDEPTCVADNLRVAKIELNDANGWRDAKSRAKGLRRLAIAQLGSRWKFTEEVFWGHVKTEFGNHLMLSTIPHLKKMEDVYSVASSFNHLSPYDCSTGLFLDALTDSDTVVRRSKASKKSKSKSKKPTKKPISGMDSDYEPTVLLPLAEMMVQALIKMKIPGTKYLYLTEQKSAKSQPKTAKKTAAKAKAKKRR